MTRGSVCVVTTSYPVAEGDPSGHFVEAEVRELERAGHPVQVVKPDAGGAFGWPGVEARLRQRPWRIFDAGGFVAASILNIRRARPSRIVAHWCVPSGFPIATSADLDGVDLELVSHGADVRLLNRMPRRAREYVVRVLVERASRWRFVSEGLRDELLATLPTTLAMRVRQKSVVVPSPLGMPDVGALVRERRRTLGPRKLYVAAARLVASKRVDKVIDYVASEHRHHEPMLVVLGDGPERERLEEVAHRWRIDARFLGKTTRPEALSWIGAADEFVHASEVEGFSTVLREAEHLGVKVTVL